MEATLRMSDSATNFYLALERSLSKPRLEAYRNGGTNHEALCRYFWNTAICESLYPSFQILEVAFRNATHIEIGKTTPEWLISDARFLYDSERESIEAAKKSIADRRCPLTEPLLVAEMKFGFWTSLLDSRYETLWHKIIKGVFPSMPKVNRTRPEASAMMNKVRRLRNAALHHHSIWHWNDLREQHQMMHELIGWICPSAEKMAKVTDRFPSVYSAGFEPFGVQVASIAEPAIHAPISSPPTA